MVLFARGVGSDDGYLPLLGSVAFPAAYAPRRFLGAILSSDHESQVATTEGEMWLPHRRIWPSKLRSGGGGLMYITPAKAVFGSVGILLMMIGVRFFLFYDETPRVHT